MNRKDMIPRELIEGVQKMLELGATREIVRGFLLEKGWNESDAEDVFSKIDAENSKPEEHKEKKASPAIIPAPVVQVPVVTSLPPLAHRIGDKRKDTWVEDASETKVTTVEQTKEKKSPTPTRLEKQAPQVPREKQQIQKVQAPLVEFKKELDKAPKKALVTKIPIRKPELPESEKKQTLVTARTNERPRKELSRTELKKTRPLDISDESQETELFEVGALSNPLALVSVALSSVKLQFWNLFFLSFMVSVFGLVLYIVLSYVVTAERLDILWTTIVEGNSSVFFVTPLLVLALMGAGVLVFTVLLWLPSAYILAFSGKKRSFRDLFISGFTGAFSLLISSVFVLLFTITGSVLLLIPGIFFAVWFVFAPLISVIERKSPFVSLLISRELVRGHFWEVVVRELFLLIPGSIFALLFILLLSPLALLDSWGLGVQLMVVLFVTFSALLFVFGILLFFFAYHVSFYKEMRARTQAMKLSRGLARALPLLLIVPLLASLAVALYVSSLV